MREYLTEDQRWFTFYPKFNRSFYIEKAGYFDERPQIHTSVTQLLALITLPFLLTISFWFLLFLPFVLFGWGQLYIHLPIRTGIQDCDSAQWGFNYHGNMMWFYIGGGTNFEGGAKWKTITMPWNLEWVRTSTLLKDGSWFSESSKKRLDWNSDGVGSYEWLKENRWKETYPYTDDYDKSTVNATISVEEREWRPLWFKWTNLFAKKSKDLKIDFDKEVGREKGSWKGGVLGCGYKMKERETPLQCLQRMSRERKF